jgi:hypothetical protein
VDDELVSIAKPSIGAEYGLSEAQAKRLRGDSADEVRRDARAMRKELGLEPIDEQQRDRDQSGRYAKPSSMNRLIRQASGR